MKPKARKFKRKLAKRLSKTKTEPVLSVSFIRKEYLEKLNRLWKALISKVKAIKLAN